LSHKEQQEQQKSNAWLYTEKENFGSFQVRSLTLSGVMVLNSWGYKGREPEWGVCLPKAFKIKK
jgi:hypothetical protein